MTRGKRKGGGDGRQLVGCCCCQQSMRLSGTVCRLYSTDRGVVQCGSTVRIVTIVQSNGVFLGDCAVQRCLLRCMC